MPYVPLEWLRDHVEVPADATAHTLAEALVRVGLEEEGIDTSTLVTGPLVVGTVLSVTPEEQKNGRVINWCHVDVGEYNGEDGFRGIVCGAHNFTEGDAVVVALPGAVLPGDFEISARKTYGHLSDGMICSEQELGLGQDHSGIIVLNQPAPPPGTDALELLGLGEAVLEVNVTPDRGYCFSMRGIAREFSHSTGAAFNDPATRATPEPNDQGFPVEVDDRAPIRGQVGCDRFVTRIVRGIDPSAPTPDWMKRRLVQAGMRPISLAVDITNYVMLDLGQPLHAYDLATMNAPITVRRANPGETLTTLDDITRDLHPEDLLITDSNAERILGIAGVMGGAETEVTSATRDVLIEAAHFDPVTVARSARRHRLPSEAARRFERGVDPQLPPVAADRVVELLVELAGGKADEGVFDYDATSSPDPITMEVDLPGRIAGVSYDAGVVTRLLEQIGADVQQQADTLQVTPPTWRPDLTGPEDLVEEVVRLHGYDNVPSILPTAPAGQGLTPGQKARRKVADLLANVGLVEVLTYPFTSEQRHEQLGIPKDDPRRQTLRLVNPLAGDRPLLRSSIVDTLIDAAVRNYGRGLTDFGIYEIASVAELAQAPAPSPLPPHAQRPSDDDLEAIYGSVPNQPERIGIVLVGNRFLAGVDSAGNQPEQSYSYADAIALVHRIAQTLNLTLRVEPDSTQPPWHPGRCAAFYLGSTLVGHAGELAPKVATAVGLPERSAAVEVDLSVMLDAAAVEPQQIDQLATYPPVKEDIALVVPQEVSAQELLDTVREAGGKLLEDVRIFDLYSGESIPQGTKSLAFALRFRAADRTLKAHESAQVREAIVDAAAQKYGATLRS